VAARAEHTRIDTSIPDATFNAESISLSADTISIGTGFPCRDSRKFLGLIACGGTEGSRFWPKALGLDAAYQEWIYEPRTITGNVNPTVNGTYHAFVHLGTFSFRYQF
jgi:long-chain fatty acid transport protein